jgi:TRAP transporter TAXI family solute receptor
LRALGQVYENYLQLIVRADGSVRNLGDLAGRPVSLGAAESGAAVEGARLVAASTVPMRVEHLLLADAIAALESGRIDALLWSGGIPTPAVARLSARTPISLLPLDGVLPAMRAAYGPVYAPVRLPSGAYAGVGALPTIGVANLLVCTPALPDAVAELVVRVLVRQAASLEPAQAVGTQFLDVRTLIDTGTVPLHPGAVAAYRALHG